MFVVIGGASPAAHTHLLSDGHDQAKAVDGNVKDLHGSALGQTIGKAGEHPKRQVSQTIDPTRTRNHGASLPASMCSVVVLIACRTLGTLKKRSVKGE